MPLERARSMPRCHECKRSISEPSEFYYCPTCGDSLCAECRLGHSHAD